MPAKSKKKHSGSKDSKSGSKKHKKRHHDPNPELPDFIDHPIHGRLVRDKHKKMGYGYRTMDGTGFFGDLWDGVKSVAGWAWDDVAKPVLTPIAKTWLGAKFAGSGNDPPPAPVYPDDFEGAVALPKAKKVTFAPPPVPPRFAKPPGGHSHYGSGVVPDGPAPQVLSWLRGHGAPSVINGYGMSTC